MEFNNSLQSNCKSKFIALVNVEKVNQNSVAKQVVFPRTKTQNSELGTEQAIFNEN